MAQRGRPLKEVDEIITPIEWLDRARPLGALLGITAAEAYFGLLTLWSAVLKFVPGTITGIVPDRDLLPAWSGLASPARAIEKALKSVGLADDVFVPGDVLGTPPRKMLQLTGWGAMRTAQARRDFEREKKRKQRAGRKARIVPGDVVTPQRTDGSKRTSPKKISPSVRPSLSGTLLEFEGPPELSPGQPPLVPPLVLETSPKRRVLTKKQAAKEARGALRAASTTAHHEAREAGNAREEFDAFVVAALKLEPRRRECPWRTPPGAIRAWRGIRRGFAPEVILGAFAALCADASVRNRTIEAFLFSPALRDDRLAVAESSPVSEAELSPGTNTGTNEDLALCAKCGRPGVCRPLEHGELLCNGCYWAFWSGIDTGAYEASLVSLRAFIEDCPRASTEAGTGKPADVTGPGVLF